MLNKICFVASTGSKANQEVDKLRKIYGDVQIDLAEVIVALGGDGFMLQTLHDSQNLKLPVYGMNYGTIGFLMNEFSEKDLFDRLNAAEETVISPLKMEAQCIDGSLKSELAINEVSLLRSGPQAANLRISVDGKERMKELVCDGALVCTPAGSTAYNYSSHGPILPIDAEVLALTAMAAYRPRRWRGAVLPCDAIIELEATQTGKRPVSAFADNREVKNVVKVQIQTEKNIKHRLLFDPGHGLEERLLNEQFT